MTRSYRPPPPAGSDFALSDFTGELLFFAIGGYEPLVATQFGERAAARVSIVVLTGPQAGKEYRNVMVFNNRPVQRFRGAVGSIILGVVVQLATNRNNAAVDVEEPGPQGEAIADAYEAQFPGKLEELLRDAQETHRVESSKQAQPQQQQRPQPQAQQQRGAWSSRPVPSGPGPEPSAPPSWGQPQTQNVSAPAQPSWGGNGQAPAPGTAAAAQGRPQQTWSPSSVLGEPAGTTREEAGY